MNCKKTFMYDYRLNMNHTNKYMKAKKPAIPSTLMSKIVSTARFRV